MINNTQYIDNPQQESVKSWELLNHIKCMPTLSIPNLWRTSPSVLTPSECLAATSKTCIKICNCKVYNCNNDNLYSITSSNILLGCLTKPIIISTSAINTLSSYFLKMPLSELVHVTVQKHATKHYGLFCSGNGIKTFKMFYLRWNKSSGQKTA